MKPNFLPRITTLSLTLLLTSGIIVVADTGCKPKPACGNKRDHRKRKKRVHSFAPAMGFVSPVLNRKGTGNSYYI